MHQRFALRQPLHRHNLPAVITSAAPPLTVRATEGFCIDFAIGLFFTALVITGHTCGL